MCNCGETDNLVIIDGNANITKGDNAKSIKFHRQLPFHIAVSSLRLYHKTHWKVFKMHTDCNWNITCNSKSKA